MYRDEKNLLSVTSTFQYSQSRHTLGDNMSNIRVNYVLFIFLCVQLLCLACYLRFKASSICLFCAMWNQLEAAC
jgi:hypothetical protein